MCVQFILGRPGFLLYPFNSHCVAWWGILESSIRTTCPNHLNLRSLIISSSFRKPVFFLISSFFTLSFHEIPNNLRWNLWCAASSFFICVTDSGHRSALYSITLTKRAIHVVWLLSSDLYPCSSRYPSAGRRHLMLSRFLCCTVCQSFHCSICGSPGNRNPPPLRFLHPLGRQPHSARHYSRVFPAVTDHIILHFAAFTSRPTYPDNFSTSSDNFCMPVCEVSKRAISSAKSKSHSFLPLVYSSPPL